MYLRRESPSSPCERMTTSRLCRVPDIKRNRLHLLGLRPNYLTGYKKRFMRWALPVYTAGMSTADSSKQYDAIILGAGASGLYCAMTAAGRGRRVLILDHAAKPGRKLSITGGGKCNLGNRTVGPGDYVGENPDFRCSALSRFTPAHILELTAAAGITLEERERGQLFCTRSAKDVVRFFVSRCAANGCVMALEEKVLAVERLPDAKEDGRPDTQEDAPPRFCVRTAKERYVARSVVVATGRPRLAANRRHRKRL